MGQIILKIVFQRPEVTHINFHSSQTLSEWPFLQWSTVSKANFIQDFNEYIKFLSWEY
jgi:hypothetical protein